MVESGLAWLADLQLANGAVPVAPDMAEPHWPTALTMLAWQNAMPDRREQFQDNIDRAQQWLADFKGNTIAKDDSVHDHDTTLIGWPWVANTHSWIEPTSYAILALCARGQADHPRVREGVRLILDRALPEGGWNYGNRRVLAHVLRPFPATTGVALAALAGEPKAPPIERAIEFMKTELQRIRAPLSLAWGVIGLRAWDALPAEAEQWLHDAADRMLRQQANPHYDALMLLAVAANCPLLTRRDPNAEEISRCSPKIRSRIRSTDKRELTVIARDFSAASSKRRRA